MNLLQYIQQHYPSYEDIALSSYYELPKDRTMADIALPCFQLSALLHISPQRIAQTIAETCTVVEGISTIVAVGPYVNFSFDSTRLAKKLLPVIHQLGTQYGRGENKHERIVVESPGPNTNKPLHLGHVRNMLLGNSLTTILQFSGFDTVKVDIINDRGIHICKSMLAYQLEGNDASPNKKSDHYVGDRYVRYAQMIEENPALEEQTKEMLRKREDNDPETRALRKRMHDRAIQGMQQTYTRYGTTIQKAYFESDHYLRGKALVEAGVAQGIFSKNEKGNIVFEDEAMGQKVVLRADGTAIYLTQDLALAQVRAQDRAMDRMIYIVGNEQEDHFKFLFRILDALGYSFAKQCHHLSYGMISLPDGKMKSRQGNTVDADSLADQMHDEVMTLLQERYPELEHEEMHRRAEIIAMGAIRFFVLKYEASKDFVFDRKTSLSFDGESGPYLQYAVARCATLLRKTSIQELREDAHYNILVSVSEKQVLLHLALFPEIVQTAADRYEVSLVARYAFELARLINSYYHHERILDDDVTVQKERLQLIDASKQVLSNALSLLGIDVLEMM